MAVPGGPDIGDTLAIRTLCNALLYRHLPDAGSGVQSGPFAWSPTIVGDVRIQVALRGVCFVCIGGIQEEIVAVERRPGCHAPHTQAVIPRRDDTRHRRTVIFKGIKYVGRVFAFVGGVIVVARRSDIGTQVLMRIIHAVVDHGDVDTVPQGAEVVGVPDLFDVDVLV